MGKPSEAVRKTSPVGLPNLLESRCIMKLSDIAKLFGVDTTNKNADDVLNTEIDSSILNKEELEEQKEELEEQKEEPKQQDNEMLMKQIKELMEKNNQLAEANLQLALHGNLQNVKEQSAEEILHDMFLIEKEK